MRFRRQRNDFSAAFVGQPQKRSAGHFHLGHAAFINPKRIAGHDQRIDHRSRPLVFGAAFDHGGAGIETDPAMHQKFVCAGRGAQHCEQCCDRRNCKACVRVHGVISYVSKLCVIQVSFNKTTCGAFHSFFSRHIPVNAFFVMIAS